MFVFTCCCVLLGRLHGRVPFDFVNERYRNAFIYRVLNDWLYTLGYQSALFWRWARSKSALPSLGLLDSPSLVSNDDDSKPTVPPPWLMPWFANKDASGAGIESGKHGANEVPGIDDDDDTVAPDGNAADGSDDRGELDDDDSFDDALKEAALVPVGWEQSSTFPSSTSDENKARGASQWSAFDLRSDDMVPSHRDSPLTLQQHLQQPQGPPQEEMNLTATRKSQYNKPFTFAPPSLLDHANQPSSTLSVDPISEARKSTTNFQRIPKLNHPKIAATSTSIASGVSNGTQHIVATKLPEKLDALVAASVAEQKAAELGGQKRRGIAFLKTYKCGSSTLGSVMFRYASRHRQRMPRVSHNIKASLASQQQLQPVGADGNGTVASTASNDRAGMCNVALQHIQAAKWRFAFEW